MSCRWIYALTELRSTRLPLCPDFDERRSSSPRLDDAIGLLDFIHALYTKCSHAIDTNNATLVRNDGFTDKSLLPILKIQT